MPKSQSKLGRGELEGMVLDVLWNDEGWMTPGEIHDSIAGRRRLAYTTVMTTLSRLWEKGRLDRRPRGRAYEYHPFSTRSEYAAERMCALLAEAGDSRPVIAHFVSQIDTSARSELVRALDAKRRRRS